MSTPLCKEDTDAVLLFSMWQSDRKWTTCPSPSDLPDGWDRMTASVSRHVYTDIRHSIQKTGGSEQFCLKNGQVDLIGQPVWKGKSAEKLTHSDERLNENSNGAGHWFVQITNLTGPSGSSCCLLCRQHLQLLAKIYWFMLVAAPGCCASAVWM